MSAASWTSEPLTDCAQRVGQGSLISQLILELVGFSLDSLPSSSLLCLFTLQLIQMTCQNSLPAFRSFLSVKFFFSDWIIRALWARQLCMLCNILWPLSYYLLRTHSVLCMVWDAWLTHNRHFVIISLLFLLQMFLVSSDFLKRGQVAFLRQWYYMFSLLVLWRWGQA